MLNQYAKSQNISVGCIFRTKSGRSVNQSNIWREMKKLCKNAKVSKEKVFPHNLRHLFAREFYNIKKDIVRLSDILGHQYVETTRIYIKSTGEEHRKMLNKMNMIMGIDSV